jgi:hypothetical protein
MNNPAKKSTTYSCSQACSQIKKLVPKKERHILILDTMKNLGYVTHEVHGLTSVYKGKLTKEQIDTVATKLNAY